MKELFEYLFPCKDEPAVLAFWLFYTPHGYGDVYSHLDLMCWCDSDANSWKPKNKIKFDILSEDWFVSDIFVVC